MTPRIPDTHAEAWDLLPWLANGRLPPTDREWVESHASSCSHCRAELATQRALISQLAATAGPPMEPAAEQRAFDTLWARIDAAEAASFAPPVADTPGAPSRTVRWLVAAVLVQGLGLTLLGIHALRAPAADAPPRGSFVTVTDESPTAGLDAPRVTLVFAPEASMATINALLDQQGLSLVAGPGRAGNFTAALSADAVTAGASAESVAAALSQDPHVTFAQPVTR